MTTKVKKKRIAEVLQRIYERAQMREKIEKDSLEHIGKYFLSRGYKGRKDIAKISRQNSTLLKPSTLLK